MGSENPSSPPRSPVLGPAQPLSECVVVIPTYNEADNIGDLIETLAGLAGVDILIADDNSPDGTGARVEQYIGERSGIFLMRRPAKQGLGNAYKEAFAYALGRNWRYICQMDADFSHDPQDLLRLLARCRQGAGMAIGSRYISGGAIAGWSLHRRWISRLANWTARFLLRCGIRDMTSGFRCFSREALEAIQPERVTGEGYIFQVEVLYRALRKGIRVEQVPICFTERRKGKSKLSVQDAWMGIRQLLRLAMQGKANHVK